MEKNGIQGKWKRTEGSPFGLCSVNSIYLMFNKKFSMEKIYLALRDALRRLKAMDPAKYGNWSWRNINLLREFLRQNGIAGVDARSLNLTFGQAAGRLSGTDVGVIFESAGVDGKERHMAYQRKGTVHDSFDSRKFPLTIVFARSAEMDKVKKSLGLNKDA